MLRGNYAAKIDDKGRLKVPTAFRALIQEQHGSNLYVTSTTGESVLIYPMPVWMEIEARLSQVPSFEPARSKFLDRVNYFGQVAEFDAQGRVLIHGRLRESAGMTGEVAVLGKFNYLEVWNDDRYRARLHSDPYTDEDARKLAGYGV